MILKIHYFVQIFIVLSVKIKYNVTMLSSKELSKLNDWYNEISNLDKSSKKIGNHSKYINLSNIQNLEFHPLIYKHPLLNKIKCINSSFKNSQLIIPNNTSCIRLDNTKNLKRVISNCVQLEKLTCKNSQISEIILPKEWSVLKRLDLRNCRIDKLQISNNMLFADSIKHCYKNTLIKFNNNTIIYDKEMYQLLKNIYINFPNYIEKTSISEKIF